MSSIINFMTGMKLFDKVIQKSQENVNRFIKAFTTSFANLAPGTSFTKAFKSTFTVGGQQRAIWHQQGQRGSVSAPKWWQTPFGGGTRGQGPVNVAKGIGAGIGWTAGLPFKAMGAFIGKIAPHQKELQEMMGLTPMQTSRASTGIKGVGERFIRGMEDPNKAITPIQKVGGLVSKVVSKLTGIPPKNLASLATSFGQLAMSTATTGLQMFGFAIAMEALQPLITTVSDIISVWGGILGTSFTPLIEKLYEVMLSPTVIELLQALANTFSNLIMAFMPLLGVLQPFIDLGLRMLIPLLQILSPLLQLFLLPLNLLAVVLTPLIPILNLLLVPLQLLGMAMDWLGLQIGGFLNGIQTMMKGAGDFVKMIINSVIGFLNICVDGLNMALGWAGVKIARIPALAAGGIITQPTVVLAGEKGREAIIPLDRGGDNVNKSMTINVYGEVTEEKLYKIQHAQWQGNLQ